MILHLTIFCCTCQITEAAIRMFFKVVVLKNFAKLTGKQMCQSLFFNKVEGLSLQHYLKSDSGTGVFL